STVWGDHPQPERANKRAEAITTSALFAGRMFLAAPMLSIRRLPAASRTRGYRLVVSGRSVLGTTGVVPVDKAVPLMCGASSPDGDTCELLISTTHSPVKPSQTAVSPLLRGPEVAPGRPSPNNPSWHGLLAQPRVSSHAYPAPSHPTFA